MRIIAGKYRGRIIQINKGREVRPTTDRVREAMFSSIISLIGSLDNACILDAFAGSGALGFESISRGAKSLVAFENDKKTYQNILKNFETLNCEEDCKFIFADIKKSSFEISLNNYKFDVIFFDPPYKDNPQDLYEILKRLAKNNNLSEKALVVYEHGLNWKLEDFVDGFKNAGFIHKSSKVYGDIVVEYFRWN